MDKSRTAGRSVFDGADGVRWQLEQATRYLLETAQRGTILQSIAKRPKRHDDERITISPRMSSRQKPLALSEAGRVQLRAPITLLHHELGGFVMFSLSMQERLDAEERCSSGQRFWASLGQHQSARTLRRIYGKTR